MPARSSTPLPREQLACSPWEISFPADRRVVCWLVEATDASPCECDGIRKPIGRSSCDSLREQLRVPTRTCFCEIEQVTTEDMAACQFELPEPAIDGWCYVEEDCGSPQELFAGCGGSGRRIRFLGSATPRPGSELFIACLGNDYSSPDGSRDPCPIPE